MLLCKNTVPYFLPLPCQYGYHIAVSAATSNVTCLDSVIICGFAKDVCVNVIYRIGW